jgi:Transposase DNA-binding/Transposase Tn5 dimerisation domain
MYSRLIMPPRAWATSNFGACVLGDERRTRRLIGMATAMMRTPNVSLPKQLHSPKALKAAYRLLGDDAIAPAAISQGHWEQTRQAMGRQPLVLLIQDTTVADFTAHPQTQGLGPIGDGRGRGFLLQSVLAVVPDPREVLGLAYHEPFLRQPAPAHDNSSRRKRRARESDVWWRAARVVGPPPPGCQWVHVGDRGSDLYEFLAECRTQRCEFLVRVAQDRRVTTPDETQSYLLTFAAGLPTADTQRLVHLSARHGQQARDARLLLSYSPVTLQPPVQGPRRGAPLAAWVIRVWEPDPPAGVEAVEWVLLTSVPTTTREAAWERVDWYRCRWLIEEYHQCLKTGCRLEQRQLQDYAGLTRGLAVLAPIAVRLLQLRELARRCPERLATATLPRELVVLVATLAELPLETLTVGRFWRAVAGYGGYLGRKGDGPPGWQTLWHGWLYIQTLLEGAQLAAHLPPLKCG